MAMIDPTAAQAQAFSTRPQDRPVAFINCHRYYDKARYPDGFDDPAYPVDVTGREAYHRYLKEVASRFVTQVGGRVLLAGPVEMVFIGEGDWDEVVIGQYPSKRDAMRVPELPGYAEIAVHRAAGLARVQTMVLNLDDFLINLIT
jgi:uncharacterized protein (DUF1330 family)